MQSTVFALELIHLPRINGGSQALHEPRFAQLT